MNIYLLCPDIDSPSGGVKFIYRYVDILNKSGFSAFVLHQKKRFRCTWFEHNTKIAYIDNTKIRKLASRVKQLFNGRNMGNKIYLFNAPTSTIMLNDFIVIPASFGPNLANIALGTKKVILNQGCYYATFKGYSMEKEKLLTPYFNKEVVATIVVSEDSEKYLRYVFPDLNIVRHYTSIDNTLFYYQSQKKKQLCFIASKNVDDIRQVINILKFRGLLDDLQLVPIFNKRETEIAQIFRESLIFLSFGSAEGFSLPPIEAMACGCIVVGYHGRGGKEFFKPEFSYPVETGDIIGFAKAVEEVINIYKTNSEFLFQKTEKAALFVRGSYSPEKERRNLVEFWNRLTNY